MLGAATVTADVRTLLALAASVALYGVFAAVERTVRGTPDEPGRARPTPPVAAGMFLMLSASGLLISLFFLGSQYLQHARGISPLETGLLFLPAALATGAGAHAGSRLVGTIGTRPVAITGLGLAALGTALLTGLSADGNIYLELLPGIVIAAAGVGPVFVAATTSALGHVEHHEAGLASGVINTSHELGAAIGVAVASTVAVADLARTPSIDGFTDAFIVFAIAAAVLAALSLRLVPPGKPQTDGPMHAH